MTTWTTQTKNQAAPTQLLTNGDFSSGGVGWSLFNLKCNNNVNVANLYIGVDPEVTTDDGTGNGGPELVTNGSFHGNANGWTLGTGWAYDSNNVTHTPTFTDSISQDIGTIVGQPYDYQCSVSGTTGTVDLYFGGTSFVTFIAGSGVNLTGQNAEGPTLTFVPSADFDGSIADVTTQKYSNSGTDYRFNLDAGVEYTLSMNIVGTTGTLNIEIYSNDVVDDAFSESSIDPDSGTVTYTFTPSVNYPDCYLDIYSTDGFDGSIANIRLSPPSSWNNLPKDNTAFTSTFKNGPQNFNSTKPTTIAVGDGWSIPENIFVLDEIYATNSVDLSTTEFLQATGFNFAIPANATIKGIVVDWEYTIGGGGTPPSISSRVIKGGVIGDVDKYFGTATELWGLTWTPDDINATNFGAAIAFSDSHDFAHSISIDFCQITVYYTTPGTIYS